MSLIEARSRKARAFRLRFCQSLASLRHLLSQASVRSTNGCTVLPTGGFVSSRRLARSFRRRNPENDFYAVPVDFDAAHEEIPIEGMNALVRVETGHKPTSEYQSSGTVSMTSTILGAARLAPFEAKPAFKSK